MNREPWIGWVVKVLALLLLLPATVRADAQLAGEAAAFRDKINRGHTWQALEPALVHDRAPIWRTAGDAGSGEADVMLGLALTYGRGVPIDRAEGARLLRRAGERGVPEGYVLLGNSPVSDFDEAGALCALAANRGSALAEVLLAVRDLYADHQAHLRRPDTPANRRAWQAEAHQRTKLLDNLARSDNVAAPFAAKRLAMLYLDSSGMVPRDPVRAHELLLLAAEAGVPDAAWQVATNFYAGQGTRADEEAARRWVRVDAGRGNFKALQTWVHGHIADAPPPEPMVMELLGDLYAREHPVAPVLRADLHLSGTYPLASNAEAARLLSESVRWSRERDELVTLYLAAEALLFDVPTDVPTPLQIDAALSALDLLREYGDGDASALLSRLHREGRHVQFDAERAVELVTEGMELGSALAYHEAGVLTANGVGVLANEARAVEFFRQAADAGVAVAAVEIGRRYLRAEGLPRDVPQALTYLQQAASNGSGEAMMMLGHFWTAGATTDGYQPDAAAARAWFEAARDVGVEQAEAALLRLELGDPLRGVLEPVDDDAELARLRKLAPSDPAAAAVLGEYLLNNGGDVAEASRWLQQAAAAGHEAALLLWFNTAVRQPQAVDPDALLALLRRRMFAGDTLAYTLMGNAVATGLGTDQSWENAVRLWRFAAERGEHRAAYRLAMALVEGQGVDPDLAGAARWLRQSAEAGHVPAMPQWGLLHYHGHGTVKDLDEAARWFVKAHNAGDIGGTLLLARCHEHGHGVRQDPARAVALYRQAAAADLPEAYRKLADFHDQGFGVPRDPTEATRLRTQAAALEASQAE
jgi:TPR repeat protein